MNFDERINRVGTHSVKWDKMEELYGVSPKDGLSMWVADMDFRPPACVTDAIKNSLDHGIFGYYGDDAPYRAAITNWMKTRHNWVIDPSWIFTTHGLVNGTALTIHTYSKRGDGVILFTPVYHAFARVIAAAGREVVECELVNNQGRYELDFDAYQAQLTGNEKMVILCSPHNPGGRVWTQEELRGVADFCVKNDLILVSDEIHHDLILGDATHIPMAKAAPDISERLVMMTAASKTFNIAGGHTGNVIIPDETLRTRFAATMAADGISPNSFGLHMTEAAYTHGAPWVDALRDYLAENARVFNEGVNAIPGISSMPLESTYLAWVDFTDTGMSRDEFTDRVQKGAKIAPNHGPSFGKGGESFLRFNLGAPRAVIQEAVTRLQDAFSDLQ